MLRGRQVHVSHGKEPKTHAELRILETMSTSYFATSDIKHQ